MMKSYKRSLIYYGLCLTLMCVMWTAFCVRLGYDAAHVAGLAVRVAGDFMLLLLPYWFLSPRGRWLVLVPAWILWAWLSANAAYHSFWNDIFNASIIYSANNLDGDLAGWGIRLLPGEYWLYFAVLAVLSAAYCKWPVRQERPFPKAVKLLAAEMGIVMFLFAQVSYFRADVANRKTIGGSQMELSALEQWKEYTDTHYWTSFAITVQGRGFIGYVIRLLSDIGKNLSTSVELDSGMRAEIHSFLKEYISQQPDSVRFNGNLVVIIVESLNSEVVGRKINGFEITPTLNRLSQSEGTVFIPKVVTQTHSGNSSDGHVLLLSGLLPMVNGITSVQFGDNISYPSIAKALPGHSTGMVLAENGALWNEIRNFDSLGMGKPVVTDGNDPEVKAVGRDAWMFRQALNVMDTIRRPFFLGLETMSMHVPFEEECMEMPGALKNADGMSEAAKKYCTVTNYFDRELGRFLDRLPANTMVIISSDHSHSAANLDGEASSATPSGPYALYMAVNTGRTQRVDRVVGQVNLYPATLELLCAGLPYYGGLAPSALNPTVDGTLTPLGEIAGRPSAGAVDTLRQALRISDLIIRSNYFSEERNR